MSIGRPDWQQWLTPLAGGGRRSIGYAYPAEPLRRLQTRSHSGKGIVFVHFISGALHRPEKSIGELAKDVAANGIFLLQAVRRM